MKTFCSFLLAYCLLPVVCSSTQHTSSKQITLVRDGTTEFVIYHENSATASVEKAARELRAYIKKASGADISITTLPPRKGPFISLGDNILYKKAGLPDGNLEHDGYILATKDGNIFIRGIDAGTNTHEDGFSLGTLFGAYSFIEDILGVRWFMPGSKGEYVPYNSTILLSPSIAVQNPDFRWRLIPYLYRDGKHRQEVGQWLIRNKINESAYRNALIHEHIWHHVFTPEVFAKHPDYFAEQGGKRVPPTGALFKICTTNPGAVRLMAEAIQQYFIKNPHARSYSMSPTDSGNWCQCSACTALDEPNNAPNGRLTRRILTFYNAVAQIVSETHPDKYCCGYVYDCYLTPPKDSSVTVEPNVVLVVASSSTYGYNFFRPEIQKSWHALLSDWTKLSKNIIYYDLPLHCHTTHGAPLSPGVKNLSRMFPALKKYAIKGLYIYGHPEWGHAALYNYLIAKLMWNADLNIEHHLEDFFSKCYGPGGKSIQSIYKCIDAAMENYYLSRKGGAYYTITTDIFKNVYLPNVHHIEQCYFEALKKTPPGTDRQRIEMLGDNLFAFNYFMHAIGLLPTTHSTRFFLTADEFARFTDKNFFALHVPQIGVPGFSGIPFQKRISARPYAGQLKNREKMRSFRMRNGAHFVMQAQRDGLVEIRFTNVILRTNSIQYTIQSFSEDIFLSGTIFRDDFIQFPGSKGALYHLLIDTESTSYGLEFSDISYAVNTTPFTGSPDRKRLHLQKQITPLYFYISRGVNSFSVTLSSDIAPDSLLGGETATGELIDPEGHLVRKLTTVSASTDKATIDNPSTGFWKLRIGKAFKGYLDDVYVRIEGEGFSGFASFDPDKLLIINN